MIDFLKKIYFRYLWWFWQVVLIILAVFFMILGIQVLIFAYRLNDPFDFILSFFASNLMILISLVLLVGFIYRMFGVYRLISQKRRHSDNCQE
ncbi:MAG: hypothetical protein U5L07_16440 [Desulfobacterales bacterium]|nr:hypothetical protein [Desulfobacterales bacterium]